VPTTHPQHDAVSCELVGTLRLPTLRTQLARHKSKRIVIHGLPTLPRRGKSAEYFPQNHGERVFHGTARRHAPAAKKYLLCRKKNCAESVAFSLPQDSHKQLMFGAARFGEPVLSASRGLGFHIAPRGGHSPHRLDMTCKCFNQLRILDQKRRLASSCGVSACSGALFRKRWRV
jgi:hypothetical protein